MTPKILFLFTRTPLHVGAGASVGAIDQPIQRERHTGFPIIPASSLKGSFADQWRVTLRDADDKLARVTVKKSNDGYTIDQIDDSGAAWLFGSDNPHVSFAGSLIFSEARVLAFPIRSARGSYAWITCPLMLQRAARDGAIPALNIPTEPDDDNAMFKSDGPLALTTQRNGEDVIQIVLEEYCFTNSQAAENLFEKDGLAENLAALIPDDALFQCIKNRLVILSNGTMSHFAATACEVAQHVRINDQTGTAEGTGLFNQENVPADTLFYSILSATDSRIPQGHPPHSEIGADKALTTFTKVISSTQVFQFGGDATTGLGFCSVTAGSMHEATPQSQPA